MTDFKPRYPESSSLINSQIDVANTAESTERHFRESAGWNVNLFDIAEIDAVINPAKPEDYIVYCGNPGHWKTGALLDLLRRDSEKLNPLGDYFNVYVSWEMTLKEVSITELSNRVMIPVNQIVRGEVKDLDAVKRATDTIRTIPTYFFGLSYKTDNIRKTMTIEMVEDALGILRHEIQLSPRLVCPDYLQAAAEETNTTDALRQRLSSISKHFKRIAKQFHCAVVAASQANFEVPKRDWKVPKQEDHFEAKSISQDVDKHIGLWKPEKTDQLKTLIKLSEDSAVSVTPDLLIIGLDKQRFGRPVGTWCLNVDFAQNRIRGIMESINVT